MEKIAKKTKLDVEVKLLHQSRVSVKEFDEQIEKLEKEVADILSESTAYKELVAIRAKKKKEQDHQGLMIKQLRESAVLYWISDECDQKLGQKIMGGTITISDDHSFDKKSVMVWAKENAKLLIKKVLDEKSLKSIAEAQADDPDGLEIPTYKIDRVIKFRIDGDLTKHIEEEDEKSDPSES